MYVWLFLSGCNYNIKALSDGKQRPINNGLVLHCFLYGHLIFLIRNYVLQVKIATFPMRFDYTSYAPRRPAFVRLTTVHHVCPHYARALRS